MELIHNSQQEQLPHTHPCTMMMLSGGLQSGATLINVCLDVGPLPPRSSSLTVTGCQLGEYPAGGQMSRQTPMRPPRRCSPTRRVSRQQQQVGGKENILLSATGPSTARCSKDVTTHQHRPGASPGLPCPVPACSWQPLPGERRLSPPLGNRIFL